MDFAKIKLVLWSGLAGAIATAFIGFNFGGWVTGGTAQAIAKEAVVAAVIKRLGAICVAQLDRDPAKSQKIKAMQGKDPWDKGKFIETQPWAIMPGDEKPENGVADECARQLSAKE